MATVFPVILNGIRFKVNPRSLEINKTLKVGSIDTQGGVVFQFWYNNPETLTISGMSAGNTAFQELLFLRQNYDVTIHPGTISQLFYKTKTYRGFLTGLKITHNISRHLLFEYSMTFQLLQGEQFKVEDFSLTPSGTLGTISTIFSQVVNTPIAGFEDKVNSIMGKAL